MTEAEADKVVLDAAAEVGRTMAEYERKVAIPFIGLWWSEPAWRRYREAVIRFRAISEARIRELDGELRHLNRQVALMLWVESESARREAQLKS